MNFQISVRLWPHNSRHVVKYLQGRSRKDLHSIPMYVIPYIHTDPAGHYSFQLNFLTGPERFTDNNNSEPSLVLVISLVQPLEMAHTADEGIVTNC